MGISRTHKRLTFVEAITIILACMLQYQSVFAAETLTGMVMESGMSGIIFKADGQQEKVKYFTGRETIYLPSEYRPEKGDTVEIDVYVKQMRDGSSRNVANQIKLLKKDPNRKELSNPATGEIFEVGIKRIRFDFPEIGKTESMEKMRGMVLVPDGWEPAAGDKVKVTYEKVKNRFTGNLSLVIRKMEKLQ